MSYLCPQCGGTGKKGKRKCKICKGTKKLNMDEIRRRSGKPRKAIYKTMPDGSFERVEGKRRRR